MLLQFTTIVKFYIGNFLHNEEKEKRIKKGDDLGRKLVVGLIWEILKVVGGKGRPVHL